jgi:hypothetical protein
LGSKEPIRHFYLLFELLNLCCLLSYPFLKSGDHRIFGGRRGLLLWRNLAFRFGGLLCAQVDDACFDGFVFIQPGRRDTRCLSDGFEGEGARCIIKESYPEESLASRNILPYACTSLKTRESEGPRPSAGSRGWPLVEAKRATPQAEEGEKG